MDIRTGNGYDVHALAEGLPLWLGGVEIESPVGCMAHSDGDVAIHALCDALLGALALGDIGKHFPDTSDEFKGIDSKILLARTAGLVRSHGYRIGNADITIVMQRPKLAPYIETMRETLSAVVAGTVLMSDGSSAAILPEIWYMLCSLPSIPDYNKVVASYADGRLYLVIAQGRSLLLCSSYQAADFTTAEYFIFLAMKKLQLNMEMSTIFFRTPLGDEDEISLYRYFKAVDHI